MKRKIKQILTLALSATLLATSMPLSVQNVEAVAKDAEKKQILHFDTDPAKSKSEVFHGSTGFLYGVSEVNVPSADMITGIAPKILVQKAADGQQHPSGDGYRLTPYLKACGVENIQIYLQDFYLQWPYESNGIEDYNEKVKQIVTKMVKGKSDEEIASYSFVIFNEPNNIWYGGQLDKMCEDWKKIYTTIKTINPEIKVAGPNFSYYNDSKYDQFFEYCEKNDCLPEYITWHELDKSDLNNFADHCKDARELVKTYYADSDIKPILFVNETVNFNDVGNPGALVNWLSIYDEEDVYASLPYWGLANSLNELAADANKPNGAWWVYRWYAQMSGKKAPLTLENVDSPGAYGRLYGMTSVDEDKQTAYVLFGGKEGEQYVTLDNLAKTKTFGGAKSAHVKIYRTKFTGQQGFADETPIVYEGNVALDGEGLSLSIADADLMDAYFAVITPAADDTTTALDAYEKTWTRTYEAEDAEMIGGAKAFTKTSGSDLARSNRAEVGGLNSEKDGVKFTVEVPKNGNYRLNIYYSNQAPQVDPITLQYVDSKGQNRAVGALCRHTLSVDGKETQDVVYDSTVKWGYYNYKTVEVELAAGKHEIVLKYKGEDQNGKDTNSMLCALLDKIDLTYKETTAVKVTIGEEMLTKTSQGTEAYVNAPEEGYYTLSSKGNGTAALAKSRVNYAKDAKAESDVTVDKLALGNVTFGTENAVTLYLTQGINHLYFDGTDFAVEELTFVKNAKADQNAVSIEAEDCAMSGTASNDDYTFLPGSVDTPEVVDNAYASGGKAVEGFRGGKDNELGFTVNVSESGDYKLAIRYANDEPAPVMRTKDGNEYVHPYNTDLVERYMQISVNGRTPQTVYFKNTFCWDTFKTVVVDVKLEKGDNAICFTNDNSYKFSSMQDDFTPRLDKFVLAPATVSENMPQIKVNPGVKDITPTPEPTQTPAAAPSANSSASPSTTPSASPAVSALPSQNPGVSAVPSTAAPAVSKKVSLKKLRLSVSKVKGKRAVKVKWKRDTKASGYQIVYGTKKNLKSAKTKWIRSNKVTSVKIKRKGKKPYYVKARAFKKVGNKKVYGGYSKTIKVS